MRVQVGGVRLFFDVDGTKLVADGPWMRERPTVVLLHPGAGFDHGLFKIGSARGSPPGRRSCTSTCAARAAATRATRGPATRAVGRRHSRVLRCAPHREARDFRARLWLDGRDRLRRPPSGPPRRTDPWSTGRPNRARALDRRLRAPRRGRGSRGRARYYDEPDEQAFADFLRVCLPLLSTYPLTSDVIVRAQTGGPEVLVGWMAGEAKMVDLRERLRCRLGRRRSSSPARTTRGRRSSRRARWPT